MPLFVCRTTWPCQSDVSLGNQGGCQICCNIVTSWWDVATSPRNLQGGRVESPCISCEFVLLDFRETRVRCRSPADSAWGDILNQNKRFLFSPDLIKSLFSIPPWLSEKLLGALSRDNLCGQIGGCVHAQWEIRDHRRSCLFPTN